MRTPFKKCQSVPVGFLTFLGCADFRHNSRSIAALISEIPALDNEEASHQPRIDMDQIRRLPLSSTDLLTEGGLTNHLWSINGAERVVRLWDQCTSGARMSQPQRIYHDTLAKIEPGKYHTGSLTAALPDLLSKVV